MGTQVLRSYKAQAYNGSNFFSEIRPFGKVAASIDSAGYAWTLLTQF